jgi:hypothetical protein
MKYTVTQTRIESTICTDYIEVEAESAEEAQRMVEDCEVEPDYENSTTSDSETIECSVDSVEIAVQPTA